MYLRRTTRKRKDGSEVGYLQLAHNEWDAAAGHSVVRVLHSFGREDQIDRGAIERLVGSLQRWLDPQAPPPAAPATAVPGLGLRLVESRPMGGAWALDGLWRALKIDRSLARCLEGGGWIRGLSGCCSRWSPTVRWSRSRSSPLVSGSRSARGSM